MRYANENCTCEEKFVDNVHTYTFTGKCIITGNLFSVTVPAKGLFLANQGAFVQNAFPDLPRCEREFLITGCSPAGWKN